MTIALQTRVKRSDAVMTALADRELVMADVDAGKYYSLDAIGTAIWQRLETETSVEALCTDLQARFDVSPERCAADVTGLLERLLERRLIEVL